MSPRCAAELPNAFDVVTARSFADVADHRRFIDMLLAEDGVGLVSEPPTDRTETWAAALAEYPTLLDDGVYQGIRRLIRRLGAAHVSRETLSRRSMRAPPDVPRETSQAPASPNLAQMLRYHDAARASPIHRRRPA